MTGGAARAYPIRLAENGIKVALRVTPNAAREVIEGIEERPGAGMQLRLRVRPVPDKGKANEAVIALLSRVWNIAPRDLSIVAGQSARDKVLLVAGAPEALTARLIAWFEAHCP